MLNDYTVGELSITGMPLVKSLAMTETVEDWSKVRSPSRARRRMKYGHRQNVVYRQVPRKDFIEFEGKIIGHPETIKELFRQAENCMQRKAENIFSKVYGV